MKTRISLQKSNTFNHVYESKNHVISLIQCKIDKTMESPLIKTNQDKKVISIPKLVLNENIIKRNTTIPLNGLSSTNLETVDSMRHEKEIETKPIVITDLYDQIDDMDYHSESDDSSEECNHYNCVRVKYKNSISLRKKQNKVSSIHLVETKNNNKTNINSTEIKKKERQRRDEKYIKPSYNDEETCHCKCIIY